MEKNTCNSVALNMLFLLWSNSFMVANAFMKCESMEEVTMCRSMPYNTSMFPNILNHRNIKEAGNLLKSFSPLITVDCSDDLDNFLCTVYMPFCSDHGPVPPCRELCERARSGCSAIIKKFGFDWPDSLRCDRYPNEAPGTLCVDQVRRRNQKGPKNVNTGERNSNSEFTCPAKQHTDSEHYKFMGKKYCASNCTTIYFIPKEKEFARIWVLFWSIMCLFSTAFTILTFAVDITRFRYPERPIIFLSACYFMISIAFIAGSISDEAVACHLSKKSGVHLLNQGTNHAPCTIVFMLVYFFLMSASIWWVILTLTWFLAAGLKWGHEAIEGSSQYFHAAAWAIPAAKTIAVLAMNKMDGDMLSGICFVGNSDIDALRGFVLAPLFVYLILGTLFLLAGFIALIKIRKVLKTDRGLKTDKLTKLMVRIGIFSVLYSLPAIFVIACLIYEQSLRKDWDKSWINGWSKMLDECNGVYCKDFVERNVKRPDFAVFMFKYLMLLMVGITSGFWIWSGKTIQSWKRFYFIKILCQQYPTHYNDRDNSVHAYLTQGPTSKTEM